MCSPMPDLSDEDWAEVDRSEYVIKESIAALRDAGYGIIAPNGDCVANVGYFPPGSHLLVSRKPVYGMLSVHQTLDGGEGVNRD